MTAAARQLPQDVAAIVTIQAEAVRTSFNGSPTLTDALVNAYYQRDIDALRRIGAQVEYRLAAQALAIRHQDAAL